MSHGFSLLPFAPILYNNPCLHISIYKFVKNDVAINKIDRPLDKI